MNKNKVSTPPHPFNQDPNSCTYIYIYIYIANEEEGRRKKKILKLKNPNGVYLLAVIPRKQFENNPSETQPPYIEDTFNGYFIYFYFFFPTKKKILPKKNIVLFTLLFY